MVFLGQDVLEIFDLKLLKEGYYPSYNERTNGQAANAFATAAFRFGHSLVQGKFLKWDGFRQQAFSSKYLNEKKFIFKMETIKFFLQRYNSS